MAYGTESLPFTLHEFDNMPVSRIIKFKKLFDEQKKREKKYANAVGNGKVPKQ